MAELSLQDVMTELKIIKKDVSKVHELERQVADVKSQVGKHDEALYGDAESTDPKQKGIIGAIIELRQDIKSNARWTAVLMAAINVAGIIMAAMFAAGVFK